MTKSNVRINSLFCIMITENKVHPWWEKNVRVKGSGSYLITLIFHTQEAEKPGDRVRLQSLKAAPQVYRFPSKAPWPKGSIISSKNTTNGRASSNTWNYVDISHSNHQLVVSSSIPFHVIEAGVKTGFCFILFGFHFLHEVLKAVVTINLM